MTKKNSAKQVPPSQPVGEKLLTVRIPADLHADLARTAKQEERTISQTIRFMIRWYVESRKMEKRMGR